jgi:thiol-disulfide isomerase/thioredoxin
LNVREAALDELDYRHDPALPALIAAQPHNLDPQVRLLGLMHLKQAPAKLGVLLVEPLLTDSNLQVIDMALKLLENWSGEKFGVKLADAIPIDDPKTGLKVFSRQSYAKINAGVTLAKSWWAKHKSNFTPLRLKIPAESLASFSPIYAGDFSLPALDGGQAQLSDFRGKVVLINFWTTWCIACVQEISELIALQKQHDNQLVILGISLDSASDGDNNGASSSSSEKIREQVVHTVQMRGMNYRILLDEKEVVGSRFNGGELPTTAIVDARGRIRRRFIGERSVAVFDAMIAEASKPMPPPLTNYLNVTAN